MINKKLFHKSFCFMILGQIISIFGNSILRFALPLYVLDKTGSATAFGSILALSMIPTILLSPVGGILADRVNRRNIMVALDFITSALLILFFMGFRMENINGILTIVITMMLLAVIQSFYQPSVQASIPLLVTRDNLVKANAVVSQVNALANLIGPIVGGIAFSIWGLMPIITISAVCFFLSAILEIFIEMPFEQSTEKIKIGRMIRSDIQTSLRFIVKTKPVLLKTTVVITMFNLVFYSMMFVGLPYIIKVFFGLSSTLYGVAQGILSVGTLAGGIFATVMSSKLKIQKSYVLFLLTIFTTLPIGIVLMLQIPAVYAYVIIIVSGFIFMGLCSVFTILMLSFIQMETPNELIGKVLAYIISLCMVSQPFGQAIYGILFESFGKASYWVVFLSIAVNIFIMAYAKKVFSNVS